MRAKEDTHWELSHIAWGFSAPLPLHTLMTPRLITALFRSGHKCSFLCVVIKARRRWGSYLVMPGCTSVYSFLLKDRKRQGEFTLGFNICPHPYRNFQQLKSISFRKVLSNRTKCSQLTLPLNVHDQAYFNVLCQAVLVMWAICSSLYLLTGLKREN